jgi:hypothetical protein
MSRKLTPALSVKLKKRPRGRSFEKGNGFGAAHRYKPGESGNPGGRTKCAEISAALRAKLKSEFSLPRAGRTYAEKLVDEWVEQGLGGNTAAIAAIADRAEGRPLVSVSVFDAANDPLNKLVEFMAEESARLGPPEGFVLREHPDE